MTPLTVMPTRSERKSPDEVIAEARASIMSALVAIRRATRIDDATGEPYPLDPYDRGYLHRVMQRTQASVDPDLETDIISDIAGELYTSATSRYDLGDLTQAEILALVRDIVWRYNRELEARA